MLNVIGCITQQHDLRLVALAGALCFFACATTISMIGRARVSFGRTQLIWLAAAGVVAGCGIWATHFIAMLAFQTSLPVEYDADITAISALIAIVLSGVGYWIAIRWRGPVVGGVVAGVAISAMHYVGMAAVRMPADTIWNYQYVVASVAMGVGFMAGGMYVVIRSRSWRGMLSGTVLFTIAILTMHFTGMTAEKFRPDHSDYRVECFGCSDPSATIAIAAVAFLIVALGLAGSLVDNYLARMASGEAERLRRHIGELEATRLELVGQQQQLRLLAKIATVSNQTTSITEALQFAVTQVCEFTGWEVGHSYLTSGSGVR